VRYHRVPEVVGLDRLTTEVNDQLALCHRSRLTRSQRARLSIRRADG
jgi:hypothetical protein